MRFAPLALSVMLVVFAAHSTARAAAYDSFAHSSVAPPAPMTKRSFAEYALLKLGSLAKLAKEPAKQLGKTVTPKASKFSKLVKNSASTLRRGALLAMNSAKELKSLPGKFPRTTRVIRGVFGHRADVKSFRKLVTGTASRLPNQLGPSSGINQHRSPDLRILAQATGKQKRFPVTRPTGAAVRQGALDS